MLMSLKNIFLEYDSRVLLNEIDFNIKSNDKIGIIGINGTGKSSLMKIIADYHSLEDNQYMVKKGLKIAFLRQDPNFYEEESMLKYLCEGDGNLEFEAKRILNKLALDYEKNISNLSGGQKKRLALAKVLIKPVDLLLLDEPTNHLDAQMILWLESYLSKLNCAIVLISHDRYFLDKVSNKIVEIEDGLIYEYEGNYQKYLELKAQRIEDEKATRRKLLALLKKERTWMMQGAKARSTKSKDRIDMKSLAIKLKLKKRKN